MIVFTHIPRTGGTTLRKVISERHENHLYVDSIGQFAFLTDNFINQHDFIATHCGFNFFQRITVPHTKIIILRDPVERVISHYWQLRAIDSSVSPASVMAKRLTLEEFINSENSLIRIGIDNAQLWHLISDKNLSFRNQYRNYSEEQLLDIAIENISEYNHVVTTPNLERFIRKTFDVRENIPVLAKNFHEHQNEHSSVISKIKSLTELDKIVYQKAVGIEMHQYETSLLS